MGLRPRLKSGGFRKVAKPNACRCAAALASPAGAGLVSSVHRAHGHERRFSCAELAAQRVSLCMAGAGGGGPVAAASKVRGAPVVRGCLGPGPEPCARLHVRGLRSMLQLVASVVLIAGCRLAIDVDTPMCVSDADCAAVAGHATCGAAGVCVPGNKEAAVSTGGPGFSSRTLEDWRERYSCLFEDEEADERSNFSMQGKSIQMQLGVTDYRTNEVPADLEVKACATRDVGCDDPIVEGIYPDLILGLVAFQLPHGFSGFLRLTASGYLTVRWSSNRPLLQDLAFEGPAMLTPELLSLLAMEGNDYYDPATGTLVVELLDCDGEAAEGVVLKRSSDLRERAFYFASRTADSSLSASEISTTIGLTDTPRAVGGFINLPPGSETIIATLAGTDIEFARETVVMKPSMVTSLRLYAGAAK